MTVFVYIDTSKQVSDPEHVKVFANQDDHDTESANWVERRSHCCSVVSAFLKSAKKTFMMAAAR